MFNSPLQGSEITLIMWLYPLYHIKKCGLHLSKCITNRLIWSLIMHECLFVVLECFCFSSVSFISFSVVCTAEKKNSISVAGEGICFLLSKLTAISLCMECDCISLLTWILLRMLYHMTLQIEKR